MQDGFRVAIVGAGPTGLVLGVELGLRGIATILLDSRSETTRKEAAEMLKAAEMQRAG